MNDSNSQTFVLLRHNQNERLIKNLTKTYAILTFWTTVFVADGPTGDGIKAGAGAGAGTTFQKKIC